ncbi:MAG TPA: hypothetical protein EYH39_00130 [Desulfurobacteriaceae bacterium]|nr:hypothetical protein [Desulfurobacteriaceae bacterium]
MGADVANQIAQAASNAKGFANYFTMVNVLAFLIGLAIFFYIASPLIFGYASLKKFLEKIKTGEVTKNDVLKRLAKSGTMTHSLIFSMELSLLTIALLEFTELGRANYVLTSIYAFFILITWILSLIGIPLIFIPFLSAFIGATIILFIETYYAITTKKKLEEVLTEELRKLQNQDISSILEKICHPDIKQAQEQKKQEDEKKNNGESNAK